MAHIKEIIAQAHGPHEAAYDNLGHALLGHVCPWMECLCGWVSTRGCRTWQKVGEEFDAHLAEHADPK
jgi:hypothetical protein